MGCRSPTLALAITYFILVITSSTISVDGSPTATNNVRSSVKRIVPQTPVLKNVTRDIFVFPDDLPEKKKYSPSRIPGVPSCAKGKTFCDTIEDYPRDYIDRLIPDVVNKFKDLIADESEGEDGIYNKAQDSGMERSLCPSREEVRPIQAAENKDGNWLYVVNHPNYTQSIRLETCTNLENNDCSNANLAYQTECKQKFIYRKLVSLDKDGKPFTDIFPLPSCCSCVMRIDMLKIGHAGGTSARDPPT